MSDWQIEIDVLESLVFSEQATTVGGHQALNYIPGSALLGACAAQLYNDLKQQAFDVFHSGKVKFGNGYPVGCDEQIAYPIPFAWHYAKGETPSTAEDFAHKVVNQSCADHDAHNVLASDAQPKQFRDGYITATLEYIKPRLENRMKTAINPDTARAASGQLYGYQSICAGVKYRASLVFSAINADIKQQVIDCFADTILYLGRSRSAQYGKVRVKIRPSDANDHLACTDTVQQEQPQRVSLWLLSDLALDDNDTQPLTLLPALPEANIDWSASFLRYRRYSPYNSYRRRYDLERQVIEKGSVLVYELDNALSQYDIATLQAGVGLYQESGLGRLAVNPCLLSSAQPIAMTTSLTAKKQKNRSQYNKHNKPIRKPNHRFIHWLESDNEQQRQQQEDAHYAEQVLQQLPQLYQSAHTYRGVQSGVHVGPSSSQWGRVIEKAKEYQRTPQLDQAFWVELSMICHQDDDGWGALIFVGEQDSESCFATWFKTQLRHPRLHNAANVAIHIARQARSIVQQQEQRSSL